MQASINYYTCLKKYADTQECIIRLSCLFPENIFIDYSILAEIFQIPVVPPTFNDCAVNEAYDLYNQYPASVQKLQ